MTADKPQLPAPGIPREDLGLFTDLYELTMSQAFFRQGMSATATFSLFTRTYPYNRAYFVSAGLEDVLDYLSELNFSGRAVEYVLHDNLFVWKAGLVKQPECAVSPLYGSNLVHRVCSKNRGQSK